MPRAPRISAGSKVLYSILADALVVLHAAFILWVGLGIFFLKRHPRLRALHLACVLYGVAIEMWPWVCPLTHLENALRRRTGEGAYEEGFLVHYLEKLIYLEAPRPLLVGVAVAALVCTIALNLRWGRHAAATSTTEGS